MRQEDMIGLSAYMREYVSELLGFEGRASSFRMFEMACKTNIRALEPIAWMALSLGEEGDLLATSQGTKVFSAYRRFLEKYRESGCTSPEDFAVQYREKDKFGEAAAAWRSANSRAQRERAIVERISVCMNEKLENSEIETSEASRYLGMPFTDLSDFLEGDVRRFAYAKAIEMHDDLDAFIASRDDRPETSPAND